VTTEGAAAGLTDGTAAMRAASAVARPDTTRETAPKADTADVPRPRGSATVGPAPAAAVTTEGETGDPTAETVLPTLSDD